ncbi:TadE/TadG family type IV pilus assembly protein [Mangrovibrevibacter kandeliae]|uniref:TadE/TadG family type IV pilus assembly protein n=1 Tax=Mangrovibrevibacter kandeliae TaxID=2968473 RepID=UPI00211853DA|nr:TadE/TadG family type IV pilus assembly protein [Aurantimonas sp. MSK8Z-1]MCQ8784221.1 pilus assembly protein [Aurantimonas sp. CSK15Z-1]MCW4116937.1 pilus assembly protein [Aurantimonas sp. MSK8Z-1]
MAAVEFAILAFPFFLIIFAILETSLVFLGELTLNRSVDRMARMVRTGEVALSKLDATAFRSKLCDDVGFLMDCSKLQIDLKTYASYADFPQAHPLQSGVLNTADFGYTAGAPSTIMALRVYYEWPVYTDMMHRFLSDLKDGNHLIASVAGFETEPFE